VIEAFLTHEAEIGTESLDKGLTSDEVLRTVGPELTALGFQVEAGKHTSQKIHRPVYFGENGEATLKYEVDAYHPEWRCGLEVEAGRAWMGNAVYRDLVQAMVMVEVDFLILAVPNSYRYHSGGRKAISKDYENTVRVVETLYGHTRVNMPYRLVILGY
jgi:hypothetical protein